MIALAASNFLIIFIFVTIVSGEPKRRRPNKLKPIEKPNGADVSQFQQPKKDRENFRKALVDIIM